MARSLAILAVLILVRPSLAQAPAAGAKYALLIGVDKYDKAELMSLRYTVRDVTELAAILQRSAGYRTEDVVLMTPARGADDFRFMPTAEHVMSELSLLLARTKPTDSVIVAFAGHGLQFKGEDEIFFCPTGAKVADRKTLVSLSQVYKQLEASKAGTKLLLSDCCRDDPLAGATRSSATIKIEDKLRTAVTAPPRGVVALFSCDAGQQAFESDKYRHGIFFHCIIEGLGGRADGNRDGKIELNELDSYVRGEVERVVAHEFGKLQQPNRVGSESGRPLPLASCIAAPAVVVKSPPPPAKPVPPVPVKPTPPPPPVKSAAQTPSKASGNTVFVPATPNPRDSARSIDTSKAKKDELKPIETRNNYKLYLEPDGTLTCYLPNSIRGLDSPYWRFKAPEGTINKVLYGQLENRVVVAVQYGKKVAVLDNRYGTPIGGWPKDVPGLGTAPKLTFDQNCKVLLVQGATLYRFDTQSGDSLSANGTRIFR